MNSWTAAAPGTTAVSFLRKMMIVALMSGALALAGCGGGGGGSGSPVDEPPVVENPKPGDDAIPAPQEPGEPQEPGKPQEPGEPQDPDDPVPGDDDDPVVTPPADRDISLSWRAPSERENGDALPLAQLRGYRIHYGPFDNPTAFTIDVNDASLTTYTIEDLGKGTYRVAVSAIDTDGLESALSNAMTTFID